jgi:hypothetical protein
LHHRFRNARSRQEDRQDHDEGQSYVASAQDPSVIDTSGARMFRLYQAYYDQKSGQHGSPVRHLTTSRPNSARPSRWMSFQRRLCVDDNARSNPARWGLNAATVAARADRERSGLPHGPRQGSAIGEIHRTLSATGDRGGATRLRICPKRRRLQENRATTEVNRPLFGPPRSSRVVDGHD